MARRAWADPALTASTDIWAQRKSSSGRWRGEKMTGGNNDADARLNTESTKSESRDFFVSFTKNDKDWASWVAWSLEDAGYSVFLQDWDFRGNFIVEMDKAHRFAKRTIAIISDSYMASGFAAAEWSARLAQDPAGKGDLLIPVKVGFVKDNNLLSPLIYVDITECDETEARRRLIERVNKAINSEFRSKPNVIPLFPGLRKSGVNEKGPAFPVKEIILKFNGNDTDLLRKQLSAVLSALSSLETSAIVIDTREGSLIATIRADADAIAIIVALYKADFYIFIYEANVEIINIPYINESDISYDVKIICEVISCLRIGDIFGAERLIYQLPLRKRGFLEDLLEAYLSMKESKSIFDGLIDSARTKGDE